MVPHQIQQRDSQYRIAVCGLHWQYVFKISDRLFSPGLLNVFHPLRCSSLPLPMADFLFSVIL